MYYHWGCTSIYWPLSYPFRSLHLKTVLNICINAGKKNLCFLKRKRGGKHPKTEEMLPNCLKSLLNKENILN